MTSAPRAPDAKSPPTKTPGADSRSVAQTVTEKTTKGGRSPEIDAFKIGDCVVTPPTVQPVRYANSAGYVVALNARDGEVGTWLGDWCDGNHVTTWFRLRELRPVTTARQEPVPPSSASVAVSTP
jgi:hypothetical protein